MEEPETFKAVTSHNFILDKANYLYNKFEWKFGKKYVGMRLSTAGARNFNRRVHFLTMIAFCLKLFGLFSTGLRNPRVHWQRFWKSKGSQEPKEPVLTQPLDYTP